MEWGLLLKVLALVLIVEGVMPFLSPKRWKRYLERLSHAHERQIRTMGLMLLLIGSGILFLSRLFSV